MCVVGAGGIGQAVGRLCAGAGMRVVGTRREVSGRDGLPAGFSRLEGPERLHALLGESDFVAVCCQWTPETTRLIGRAAFAAMRPGTVFVNVARGEIVDEEALLAAARERDRVGARVLGRKESVRQRPPIEACAHRTQWDRRQFMAAMAAALLPVARLAEAQKPEKVARSGPTR